MQAVPIRIFLVLFILFLIHPSALQAASKQRTALVIGNSTYSSGPLKNPVNDATDMATNLQRLGFTVTLKKNANHQQMEDAIREFGDQLKKGGVGLFFYAGHGVQIGGRNYLLPIGSRINKDTDVKFQAVDTEIVLAEMGNAGNNLNIVILDACRDNPFGKSFRSASRGLAIISDAPKGTFITYSTSPGKVAADGGGRNSPYTESLIRHMRTPGLQIEDVFKEVRKDMGRKTRGQQVPWELSSLEGQFYFIPGGISKTAEVVKEAVATPVVELDPQRREIEAERERLQKQRDLLEQKEALAKEKEELAERERKLAIAAQSSVSVHQIKELDDNFRKLEEAAQEFKMLEHKFDPRTREVMRKELELQRELLVEQRKRLAVVDTRPFATAAKEIGRDGRFIAYDNGTVLDTKTNLMWAAKDNRSEINWQDAKSYCENYRGGGYTDWRLPTQDELAGLYDSSKPRPAACNRKFDIYVATELIDITCFAPWASETRGSEAARFSFLIGRRSWDPQSSGLTVPRALPVRSAK